MKQLTKHVSLKKTCLPFLRYHINIFINYCNSITYTKISSKNPFSKALKIDLCKALYMIYFTTNIQEKSQYFASILPDKQFLSSKI